jgi:hypothetical protein
MIGAETGIGIGNTRCQLIGTGASPQLRISDDSGVLAEQNVPFSAQRMMLTLSYEQTGATTQLACIAHQADGARLEVPASSSVTAGDAITLFATNGTALFRALAVYE